MWNDQWLAKRSEEPYLPELPIVDAHHHLFEPEERRPDRQRYLLRDFEKDTQAGHNIVKSVYVECSWAYRPSGPEHLKVVGETETVAAVAEANTTNAPDIAGIVAYADLTSPMLAEVLDAHVAAGRGRFKGIRQAVAYDIDESIPRYPQLPPPDLLDNGDFRRGVAHLGERGLTYDVYLFHPQIPQLADVARAVPDTPVILNHLGTPLSVGRYAGRQNEVFSEWRDSMSELSQCPNVYVKIGGIGMMLLGTGMERADTPPSSTAIAEAWQPWVSHVLAAFGPDRCMAESNFPVDRGMCSYVTLWNAIKLLLEGLNDDQRDQVLTRTASAVYGI